MRGASALGELLARHPDFPLRALVVWEPVIGTDLLPPATKVLAQIADLRAAQLWDEGKLLSQRILRDATSEPWAGESVVWDVVALFPPGTRWEERFPAPEWADGPVVRVIGEAERRLAAGRSAAGQQ